MCVITGIINLVDMYSKKLFFHNSMFKIPGESLKFMITQPQAELINVYFRNLY